MSESLKKHNLVYVIALVAVFALYIFNLFLSTISQLPARFIRTIFPNSIGNLSAKYHIDITPANWVFPFIWNVIYLFQLAWLIYALVCLFRRTKDGDLLYRRVSFIPLGAIIAFGVCVIQLIAWLFTWTHQCIWVLYYISYLTYSFLFYLI